MTTPIDPDPTLRTALPLDPAARDAFAGTARLRETARPAAAARLTLPRWLSAAAFPLAVGVASRAFSSALLLAIPQAGRQPPILDGQSSSPFVAWDGQWYLHVARQAYHTVPQQVVLDGGRRYDFAFYPAWPGLIHGGMLTGLPAELVAVLLANLLFILALIVVHRVLTERFGSDAGRGAVLLLAFAPASYVASMAYSEPLFLLLVAGYFALRGSRFGPAAAAAAVLTRVAGLAIGASAVVAALHDRRGRASPRDRRAWPILVASLVGVVIAFLAWWDFVWWVSRSPVGWFRGSPAWLPTAGLADVERVLASPRPYELAWLAVVAVMIVLGVLLLRRDLELGTYSLTAIGMSVLGAPVSSMPRHTLAAFPVLAILASRLGPRGSVLAALVFGALQVWFVWAAFGPPLEAP